MSEKNLGETKAKNSAVPSGKEASVRNGTSELSAAPSPQQAEWRVYVSMNPHADALVWHRDDLTASGTCRPERADFFRAALNSHDALVAALEEAKETIRMWHGDLAWDTYESCSPEMKRINAALALAGKES